MSRIPRWMVVALFPLLCAAQPASLSAQETRESAELSAKSSEALVNMLTDVDSQGPGLNSMAMFGSFIADGRPNDFEGGVLGVSEGTAPPQMRELVKRGAAALPILLEHLSDSRATRLEVGNPSSSTKPNEPSFRFMWQEYSDEYFSRIPGRRQRHSEKSFDGPYRVKVGDICYALIGQIVNRWLLPVRYQPTAGLIINSPIQSPVLIERTRADWSGTDGKALEESLMTDLHRGKSTFKYGSALRRLRFYYPARYEALKGKDLAKKKDFEADEKHPS